MTQDNIIKLSQPGMFSDPLTEVLRDGARALLAHAVEAEVADFLGGHADKLTDDGHRRLVRHGHLPEREIMTGIGAVAGALLIAAANVRKRAKIWFVSGLMASLGVAALGAIMPRSADLPVQARAGP